jgi:hypothetical protein
MPEIMQWGLTVIFAPVYTAIITTILVRSAATTYFDAKLKFTERLLSLQAKQQQYPRGTVN